MPLSAYRRVGANLDIAKAASEVVLAPAVSSGHRSPFLLPLFSFPLLFFFFLLFFFSFFSFFFLPSLTEGLASTSGTAFGQASLWPTWRTSTVVPVMNDPSGQAPPRSDRPSGWSAVVECEEPDPRAGSQHIPDAGIGRQRGSRWSRFRHGHRRKSRRSELSRRARRRKPSGTDRERLAALASVPVRSPRPDPVGADYPALAVPPRYAHRRDLRAEFVQASRQRRTPRPVHHAMSSSRPP